MKINVTDLKKELFKEEVLNIFEEKILERFTVSQLKNWTKQNWETEILGTLGFSLSSLVVDFLESNRSFFEDNTDYKWEVYTDRVLDSFVNGKYIDPFKDLEFEPFFNVINDVADVLDNKISSLEENINCPHCGCNLKDIGFYSKKPPMFIFNEDTNNFELIPILADEDFEVCCCLCDNKLDSNKYDICDITI